MNTPSIAQYGILSHYPQPNRTEHVHIGVVAFLPDGQVRVHFAQDLKKLRAMDPSVNLETVRSWETGLPKMLAGQTAEQAAALLQHFGQWKMSSSLGRFTYRSEEDYLVRIANVLHSLVAAPAAQQRGRSTLTS